MSLVSTRAGGETAANPRGWRAVAVGAGHVSRSLGRRGRRVAWEQPIGQQLRFVPAQLRPPVEYPWKLPS